MPALENELELSRCPHCQVDRPRLAFSSQFETRTHNGTNQRFWRTYVCSRCGGAVLAASDTQIGEATEMYPKATEVDDTVEPRAREYLGQALSTLHAPGGSILLSASAVDTMLKDKGYTEGSLYSRIDKAKEDHLITEEMAKWAHQVRLDANEQRHADEDAPLPEEEEAKTCVNFALALAEFLYVLPARVTRGIQESEQ